LSTLQLSIRNATTKQLAPCWILLEDSGKHVIGNFRTKNLPGFPCSGSESIELDPGEYRLRAHCGFSFEWIDVTIQLRADEKKQLDLTLKPHVDLQQRGWFCGDVHNHPKNVTPAELAAFLLARGVDYLSICQGWLVPSSSYRAHDGESLATFLSSANTERVHIRIGAEYPKTRYGHVCWFSLSPLADPHGMYDDFHDEAYYNAVPVCTEPLVHPSRQIPFKTESNFSKIVRMKQRGGISMAPHPTSWWKEGPNPKIIATNLAADYILGLFAGKLYDTLVVMGYDAEHVFYQNFWFHLLNRGHKIAGVAETDGDLTGAHSVGHLRCYSQTGSTQFNLDRYLNAVKSGRTFVTSGPLVFVSADDGILPGGTLAPGKEHTLSVEAYADADPAEYLSWLVLYRNGEVSELVDVEASRPRQLRHVFKLPAEQERAWYVVKVYGSTRPERREFVDILKYAESCRTQIHGEYKEIKQVAFTNPFYVERADYVEPGEIRPVVNGRVCCHTSGKPLKATVRVLHAGIPVMESSTDSEGRFELQLPLTDEVEIEARGYALTTLNVPVHYAPIADLLDEVIAGRWALDGGACWQPGQAPFEIFQYDRLKKLLSGGFNWEIPLTQLP
jgi:hypothetical protein